MAPRGGIPDDAAVALAHDYLLVVRGAERTFAAIADLFPGSPMFTTVYSERGTAGWFASRNVITSPLQRLRPGQDDFRRFLPLYAWAVGRLPTADFPLVISSSSAFAIGVPRGEGAVHICYCHTPFRYAWHERDRAIEECPRPLRPVLGATLARYRRWERRAAERVNVFIANSEVTRGRIADVFEREAVVLHPPVDVHRFRTGTVADYFLIVSELVAHKRVELALHAARKAGAKVRIVGGGPELDRLRANYGDVAEFLGRIRDEDLVEQYAGARALVVTAPEEFGIVAVEAQAAGRPVLAFDVGGARETVLSGRTGERVPDGDVDALAQAMRDIDFARFSPDEAQKNAARYSTERFAARFEDLVDNAIAARPAE